MPKEIVYGEPLCFEPNLEGDEAEIKRPVVDLRWNRMSEGGLVQIVTRMYDKEVPSPEEYVNGTWSVEYGLHVSLDRAAINDLIRNLRRARDAAFGRDE